MFGCSGVFCRACWRVVKIVIDEFLFATAHPGLRRARSGTAALVEEKSDIQNRTLLRIGDLCPDSACEKIALINGTLINPGTSQIVQNATS